jgi:hypothetical protein
MRPESTQRSSNTACIDPSSSLLAPQAHNPRKLFIDTPLKHTNKQKNRCKMADDEDIAALVIDNGSGMCKGT